MKRLKRNDLFGRFVIIIIVICDIFDLHIDAAQIL